MIALRVDDGYGGSVSLTLAGEGAFLTVDVEQLDDLILDAADLRDLARIATLAADELDRTAEVTP